MGLRLLTHAAHTAGFRVCGALPEGDGCPLSRNGFLPIESRTLRASCPSNRGRYGPPALRSSRPFRGARHCACVAVPERRADAIGVRGQWCGRATDTDGRSGGMDAVAAASRWPWMANRPSGRPRVCSPAACKRPNKTRHIERSYRIGIFKASIVRSEAGLLASRSPKGTAGRSVETAPAHRFADATGLLPFAPAAPFGEHAAAPASPGACGECFWLGALPKGDGCPLSRNGFLPIESRTLRASCPSLQPPLSGSTPLRLHDGLCVPRSTVLRSCTA